MKILQPKGRISSGFGAYESVRDKPHTGIDFVQGYRKSIISAHEGVVAELRNFTNPNSLVYKGISVIADTDQGLYELHYGHVLPGTFVKVGDLIPEGVMIAHEGNTGDMNFSGGQPVTAELQAQGRGAHLHFGLRPVVLDDTKITGEHYRPYKYQGKFVRCALKDNGYEGCINPTPYFYTPTYAQWLGVFRKVVEFLLKRIERGNISI